MSEPGLVFYLCPRDDTEWSADAVMLAGNFDPVALGNGDSCPICGAECDQITNWQPETPEGYRLWLAAADPEGES